MKHAPDKNWTALRVAYLFAASMQMGVLYWLSSKPSLGDEPLNILLRLMNATPGGDKIAHAIAYAVLAFLLTRGFGHRGWGIAITVLYGLLDEYHQSFVPGRDAGLADWLADSLGAVVGSRLATKRIPGLPHPNKSCPTLLENPEAASYCRAKK
ncbi:MAG: VanZ family protein [Planctomycetota bacterium]